MAERSPRVGIGLPVHNGENFVREAIESILAQDFGDFELVISDNASTDGTEEICRAYAARDGRVSYHRNPHNVGSSGNYTRTFELSRGEYFKWAAHDDVCLPGFLGRSVEVLDRDAAVVLCYTRVQTIDATGRRGKEWPSRPAIEADTPTPRFADILASQDTFPIWGVMRRDVLARTPLLGNYPAHDRPLLAELSLYGRFREIDEILFLEREHPGRSVRAHDFRDPHAAVAWYDPAQAGKLIFPAWRLLKEYEAAVRRAPLSPAQRARCRGSIASWTLRHRSELLRDLHVAATRGRMIGPLLARRLERHHERSWTRRTVRAVKDIATVVPRDDSLILVDEASLEPATFSRWRTIPFLERDGAYDGPPPDDGTGIRELERLRGAGAGFVAFTWPAFWWLDHYATLHRYLVERFRCRLRNDRVVLFDLRQSLERAP